MWFQFSWLNKQYGVFVKIAEWLYTVGHKKYHFIFLYNSTPRGAEVPPFMPFFIPCPFTSSTDQV